jgi:hypothetical protein
MKGKLTVGHNLISQIFDFDREIEKWMSIILNITKKKKPNFMRLLSH